MLQWEQHVYRGHTFLDCQLCAYKAMNEHMAVLHDQLAHRGLPADVTYLHSKTLLM